MKTVRIVRLKEPLEIKETELPKPIGSQVIIKVQSAGVDDIKKMVKED